MSEKFPKIGVVMYTYNRTDDARINMEVIRNVWGKNEMFSDVKIVHAFNGEKSWWPEKYLEDEILYLENPGHFSGAELLITKGVDAVNEKFPDTDYVILLASDTWCTKPEYIERVIKNMIDEKKYLATCAWGTKEKTDMFEIGMALDFLIFDLKWSNNNHFFPIRYSEFFEKYREIFLYQDIMIYPERVMAMRFKQSIMKAIKFPSENLLKKITLEHIYRMTEREPIHIVQKKWFGKISQERKMYWPDIGILTQHDPFEKQKILKSLNLILGEAASKFIAANDVNYYNHGLVKTEYVKNGKKINYTD